jgi:hypothetical protein
MKQKLEYNQKSQILFIEIHQIFSLFFIPSWLYKSDVHLTTKLHLAHLPSPSDPGSYKYYITCQEDLYQTNEWVKFFWPGGATIIWCAQLFATFVCIVGALALAPVTWFEQRHANRKLSDGEKKGL